MIEGAKSLDGVRSPSNELFSFIDPSLVFSNISRLNASTPLSTPSTRSVADDDDDGIVLARKGFRVVDGGGRLGSEYCSCDVVVVVRSGMRAASPSASTL